MPKTVASAHRRPWEWVAVVALLVLLATACGSSSEGGSDSGDASESSSSSQEEEVAPQEDAEPASEFGEEAAQTSGEYSARWDGYTYDVVFEASYGDVEATTLDAAPGSKDLTFGWHIEATFTNTTAGERRAPAPARVFSLEAAFPKTSLLCALGQKVNNAGRLLRYPDSIAEEENFNFCFAKVVPLSDPDADLGNEPQVDPGEAQEVSSTGTYAEEVDEEFADAAVTDLGAGPAVWVSGPVAFGAADGSGSDDDCLGLLWWSSPTSPCDVPLDEGEVEGSPVEAFVGTWAGTAEDDGSSVSVTLAKSGPGLAGSMTLGECGRAELGEVKVVQETLSAWYPGGSIYCSGINVDLVLDGDSLTVQDTTALGDPVPVAVLQRKR